MNMTNILNPDEGGELTLWLNGGARPSAEPLYSAGRVSFLMHRKILFPTQNGILDFDSVQIECRVFFWKTF